MTQSFQKKYHKLYQDAKAEHDPHVIEWISKKEDIVASAPFSFSMLKHDFPNIRRFKGGGKIRIFYALSTEKPELWETPPQSPEILFLYVDLRSDETYTEALKLLRKHQIL